MWLLQRFPQDRASTETYPVPLTRVVYIERADFRVEDAKDYYGLAPGKSAMLRWGKPWCCAPQPVLDSCMLLCGFRVTYLARQALRHRGLRTLRN